MCINIIIYFPIQFLFPYRFLQNIECSSHCYTVGPCWLSVSIKFSWEKPEERKWAWWPVSLSLAEATVPWAWVLAIPKWIPRNPEKWSGLKQGSVDGFACETLCGLTSQCFSRFLCTRMTWASWEDAGSGTWDSASLTGAWEMRFCWFRNHILRNRACEMLSAYESLWKVLRNPPLICWVLFV